MGLLLETSQCRCQKVNRIEEQIHSTQFSSKIIAIIISNCSCSLMQWLLILLQSTLVLQLFCLLGQSQSADGCCVFGFHAIGSWRHSISQHTRSPILVTFSRDIDGLSKALHGSISEKWFVYNLGIGSLRKENWKSHRTSFPKRRKRWKKRKPITLGPN